MVAALNKCRFTGSAASLQVRFELAKIQPVEIDEMNENDVRVVAAEGDNCTPWDKARNTDQTVALWNEANPA